MDRIRLSITVVRTIGRQGINPDKDLGKLPDREGMPTIQYVRTGLRDRYAIQQELRGNMESNY